MTMARFYGIRAKETGQNLNAPEQGDEEPDEIEPEVEFEPPEAIVTCNGPSCA